jgi:hypothetical protein
VLRAGRVLSGLRACVQALGTVLSVHVLWSTTDPPTHWPVEHAPEGNSHRLVVSMLRQGVGARLWLVPFSSCMCWQVAALFLQLVLCSCLRVRVLCRGAGCPANQHRARCMCAAGVWVCAACVCLSLFMVGLAFFGLSVEAAGLAGMEGWPPQLSGLPPVGGVVVVVLWHARFVVCAAFVCCDPTA